MKKIIGIIFCICMLSMLLAGCGETHAVESTDRTQVESVEPTDEAKEVVEPIDELSQKAKDIIENYQGDGSDEEYIYIEMILTNETTRQILLADLAAYEQKIAAIDSAMNFIKNHGNEANISMHEEQKKQIEEKIREKATLLMEVTELQEETIKLKEKSQSQPIL